MPISDADALALRLHRLELLTRSLAVGVGLLVLALASLILRPASSPSMSSSSPLFVSKDGRTKIVLGEFNGCSGLIFSGSDGKNIMTLGVGPFDVPALTLYPHNGDAVAKLYMDATDVPSLSFYMKNDLLRADLGLTEKGDGVFELRDKDGGIYHSISPP